MEALTKIISGKENSELKDAFKALESQVPIHGALREGFLKLYGYSSDEDGIRHAILEEKEIGFDEAKFMLVACSGFDVKGRVIYYLPLTPPSPARGEEILNVPRRI